MQFKLGDFFVARAAISAVTKQSLPVKAAFRLGRLVKKADELLQDLEKHRIELIMKHGTKDEGGNMSVLPDSLEAFQTEFAQLLDEDIEVSYTPLTLDELGDVQLSPADAVALEPFIQD